MQFYKAQVAWNKGLTKETSESVRKQAEQMKGDKNPACRPEVKKKRSISNKNRICSEETRKKMSNFRRGKSKYLLDFSVIKFCKCGCEEQIQIKNDHRYNGIPDYIQGHYTRLQVFPIYRDTSIEIKLQEALKELNIKFKTHIEEFGRPDIFIEPNICIFCDGDYWHANPTKYRENDFIRGTEVYNIWKYDIQVTSTLQEKGFKILRFWEHEINNNLEDCVMQIKGVVI